MLPRTEGGSDIARLGAAIGQPAHGHGLPGRRTIQAFTEQGWSWGGSWVGFSDAMHFDYMGSVTDVIEQ
jgi:D-alanyl-D-alanine carboxypeptidase